MQKLFEECRRIYEREYVEGGGTMVATTSVLKKLQEKLEVIEVQDSNVSYKFIVNGCHGLFAKSVAYSTKRTRRDEFDKEKVCTEIGNATRAIRKFFKHRHNKQYILGLNLGNEHHDMAVFIGRDGGKYDLVHFDPNERASSLTMDKFQISLSKSARRRGYHSKNGNLDGKCSLLSWVQ